MDEIVIVVTSGAVGVALASTCIWLFVRAINRREVLWIAFTVLPFALVATLFGCFFTATFAREHGWLLF